MTSADLRCNEQFDGVVVDGCLIAASYDNSAAFDDSHFLLTDVEAIHRLLTFDSDLKQAYQYYQALTLAVHQKSKQLLAIKSTVLPAAFQRVQRTLRLHKTEIITSFNRLTPYPYTNGPVEEAKNKIKVIKRTAYGFRNFYYFCVRI